VILRGLLELDGTGPFDVFTWYGMILFISSIEIHEGEDTIKMVMDFLGDGVLMYA
jgi:hypothetical protein